MLDLAVEFFSLTPFMLKKHRVVRRHIAMLASGATGRGMVGK